MIIQHLLPGKEELSLINEKKMKTDDDKSLKYKIGKYTYISSSKNQIPDYLTEEILQNTDDPDYFKRIGSFFITPIALLDYKKNNIGTIVFIWLFD